MVNSNNNIETGGGRIGSVLNIIVGVYLLMSPFMLNYADLVALARNDIATGFIVLLLGIIGAVSGGAKGARWLMALFGIWLFFSPFALGYAGALSVLWNHIILGVLIVIFSAWRTGVVPHPQTPSIEIR